MNTRNVRRRDFSVSWRYELAFSLSDYFSPLFMDLVRNELQK